MFRFVAIVCAFMGLAGCVTVSNSLTADQIKGFRLAGTNVTFARDAKIWWGDGERAYATTKGIPATEADAAAKTPEGQAYLRGAISSKVKAAMERGLADRLTGSKPVRVEIIIKDVRITSAVQRVIIGGDHHLKADINLVDVSTGAVVLNYPEQTAVASGGGIAGVLVDGVAGLDPLDLVIRNCVSKYRYWLLGQA